MDNGVVFKGKKPGIHVHTTEDFFSNTEEYVVLELNKKTAEEIREDLRI